MKISSLLLTASVLFGLALPTAAAAHQTLTVGSAKIDITPKDLTGLNPIGGLTFAAVNDPIFLRALVVSDGRQEAAIVTLDLIEIGNTDAFRARIENELGIAASHVILNATHDHSAPRIGHVTPGALAHEGTAQSLVYTEFVYDTVIKALKEARAHAKPARFGVGRGGLDINVNRDAYDPKRGWGLGYNTAGPSDDTMMVAKFEDLDGKPIGAIFNYAVHSVVTFGTNRVSGDLAGAAEAVTEKGLGDGAVALFTAGPIGDQNPRLFPTQPKQMTADSLKAAYDATTAQGLLLGSEVLRVADGITETTGSVRLFAADKTFSCPVQAGTEVMADMKQAKVDNVAFSLGLIRLNDFAMAGVSGEVVTPLYRHLQAETPLNDTMLVSIANDRVGYIADDAAYDTPLFEVKGSPAARGCAEDNIVSGIVSLIRSASQN
jgi:hypothetical protein